MSLGRRKAKLEDESAWVFNRMVDAYDARPAYPDELLNAVTALLPGRQARVGDVGAGIGHFALPLAAKGFDVTAVEPAKRMLDRLQSRAASQGLELSALHGTAEAMPVADGAFDLVLISDAVHFLDRERAAYEVKRVLSERGALVLVTCEFSPTPFMLELTRLMQAAAPRRPRNISSALKQLISVPNIKEQDPLTIVDCNPIGKAQLRQILRSISFIGPAMNPDRAAAFEQAVEAIPVAREWSRTFKLRRGFRRSAA